MANINKASNMALTKVVGTIPTVCAIAPSTREEIGMIPIANSCIPRALPCTAGSVVINRSVVCNTPNAALIRPMPPISANDSGTDCDKANIDHRKPHTPVPKTNNAP